MNAAAEPFVPKEDVAGPDSPSKPQQGLHDSSGVETDSGGLSGVQVWRPQYKGKIRSFSDQKGFGFIDCADTLRAFGRDVFIHRFQMAENELKVGQEVIFEVELSKMGHPQGRRIRPNHEDAMAASGGGWDMSQMGGQMGDMSQMGMGMGMGQMAGGQHFGGGGGMYRGGMGGGMGGGWNQGQNRAYGTPGDHGMGGMMASQVDQGPPEAIEEMLRGCAGSADMWEIIEQFGHSFGKKHVVTALYQLGLCRQYEKRAAEASLTGALVDRLVLFSPTELTADEASRVLWALAVLEEINGQPQAHRFAMELGEQAVARFAEFTPAQMAGFVSSLSRLVRNPSEDELVGKITTQFSDYALGGTGALPRFAPHELSTWTNFLKEAANQAQQPPGGGFGPMAMPGKGGFGQPGSYAGQGGPGMMPPWGAMGGKGGMPGMPPMGKGPMPGGGGGFPGKGGKDSFGPGPMDGKGGFGYGGKPGFDSFGGGPGGKPGFDGYGLGPGGKPGFPGGMPGGGGPGGGPPGSMKGKGGDMGGFGSMGGKPGPVGGKPGGMNGGKGPGGDMPGGMPPSNYNKGGPSMNSGPGPMGRPSGGMYNGGMNMGGPGGPPGKGQQPQNMQKGGPSPPSGKGDMPPSSGARPGMPRGGPQAQARSDGPSQP